jgi:RNA polymerase sigma-70 factor (ECF subfamily)
MSPANGKPRLVPAPVPPFADDATLAAAAARGEPAARRELVARVLDPTRRVVGYLLAGSADADDVVQNALLQLLGAAGGFRGECSLEFFATRIAVRTAMREIRKWRRREQPAGLGEAPAGAGPRLDEEEDLRRVRVRLAALLGKLKPERRVAVVLHHVEGYGLAEIAEATGAPLNTVRDRVRVGRRQLRQRILADPGLRDWLKARPSHD